MGDEGEKDRFDKSENKEKYVNKTTRMAAISTRKQDDLKRLLASNVRANSTKL